MKCKATKPDGSKCMAQAMLDSNFCFRHNKTVEREAIEASSIGGQARKQYIRLGSPTRLRSPKDIQNLMARAINSLWTGKMPSNNPAGALGYLAKIFLEAYEKSELEQRIELLEKRLEQTKT